MHRPGRKNKFNPSINVVLEGRYANTELEEVSLPGFQLGGESHLAQDGFSTGHNEIRMSANIDDTLYGEASLSFADEDGETHIEIEEIFAETSSLAGGSVFKMGRFLSSFGYQNALHAHSYDFADNALAYTALLGGHLVNTGLHMKWIAPTSIHLSLGLELFQGDSFPGGEHHNNLGGHHRCSGFLT